MPLIDYKIIEEHIAILTLNRPEVANAMSKNLLDELNNHLQRIDQTETIRCVIITGAGEKAFCAGADLKERKEMSDDQVISAVSYIGKSVTTVEQLKIPVIAAMNGVAFGGGLELALACDIRIASENAKMGLTETSLAIIPGAGGTQRLSRLIGLGQAKRLIYTAKPVTSTEALEIGLIEKKTISNDVVESAIEIARLISNNGPVAIKQAKTAINQGFQTDITTGLAIEHLCYKETIPTGDRTEGLQAFRGKRKPVYKGK
ncbi:enoyl-CoA hydratase [Virgibacillus byunsanensis]|uniref:Enoyl-CoA hydratase n=1 Tax=Virgibacillus byunsanensis TaxID=570945 RepID=A0ABW3LIC2_9BACI